MRCKHCWIRVVGIPQVDAKGEPLTVMGKGDPPNWKHDVNDKSGPTCGMSALRDKDVENDPDASPEA